MASVLLVGGSHHGETIDTGDRSPIAVQLVAATFSWASPEDPQEEVPVESYGLARLVLFGRTVTVGLGPGMTTELAVPSLLSGPAFALWSQAPGA